MELLFVIAIFEDGVHKGYWWDEGNDLRENLFFATAYDSRKIVEESLGEVPRKYDARIFSLQPVKAI